MTMNKEEAQKAAKLLALTDGRDGAAASRPMRGSLDGAVPVDPTIYRFHELVQVYGNDVEGADPRRSSATAS